MAEEKKEPVNYAAYCDHYFPIRCTCNKVISPLYGQYVYRLRQGEDSGEILTSLGLTRYCCRKEFITHRPPTLDYSDSGPVLRVVDQIPALKMETTK